MAFLLVFLCLQLAMAQGRDIRLEIGFSGQIVANAWNPLKLRMRDQPASTLIIEIDQGNLRDGAQIVRYEVSLQGGSGIEIFQDDLYIPAWRSFVWKVQSEDALLASGSFGRRSVDPEPLQLLLSENVGALRPFFPENARVVEVFVDDLPERAAAYDGVASLVIDGTTTPPRLQAVVAATTVGVTTFLDEAVSGDHQALLQFAREVTQLGAGQLLYGDLEGLFEQDNEVPRLELEELQDSLLDNALTQPPEPAQTALLVILAGVYGVCCLLLLRFGRVPGLISAFALAIIASLSAWFVFRPDEPSYVRSRTVTLESGSLGIASELRSVFSLPEADIILSGVGVPRRSRSYTVKSQQTYFIMRRWSSETFRLKPFLLPATLAWQDDRLVNIGDERLVDVLVVGWGLQGSLDAQAGFNLRTNTDTEIPEVYRNLIELLPANAVVARRGGRITVRLPEYDLSQSLAEVGQVAD